MPRNPNDDNKITESKSRTGLWTVDEVARFLRCSKDAIYRMVERQEIPHIRVFKRKGLRFRPEEIEGWLASQRGPHAKES
ncbi:MAG: helix-turn-helix domain-containing protein [Candidatus Latescibacterota bacterium]|nr:MAG: helix-turn-helix domain-containing protein [Candidatus Latescibacterota bacterium]